MSDAWPDEYDLASDAVKRCAESVKEDNPDMDKETAFAVCQSMDNKGQLQAPEDDGTEMAAATAETTESASDDSQLQPFRAFADAEGMEMSPPGPVKREEQDDGSVRYTNLLILAPGEWTDAATGETIFYSPDLTRTLADEREERVKDDSLNLNHEHTDQLKQVGNFDRDTLAVDDHANLYSDVVLWNDTTTSEDAVALMDRALRTEGRQGAGGLSVEIPFENEVIEFDQSRGMKKMVAADLAGLAIVTDSASAPAAFEEQLKDRAIAMSAHAGGAGTVRAFGAFDTGEPDVNVSELQADVDAVAAEVREVKELAGDVVEQLGA